MNDQQIEVERENVVQVLVPSKVSQLENDEEFQTKTEVEEAVATEAGLREAADAALQQQIDNKQDTLEPGTNITIYQGIISGAPLYGQTGTHTDGAMTQKATSTALSNEATARGNADENLQQQIDAITASSDVADVVGTKAELNSYDTSKLTDNDVIKVLADESQNGATTYYRWNKTSGSFTLIGSEGPFYTKSEADTKFVTNSTYTAGMAAKQNNLSAGDDITIEDDTVSLTLRDDSILPDKTTFNKLSGNLLDPDTTNIYAGSPQGSTNPKYLAPGPTQKTVYIPCLPNTTYTVSRRVITARFGVFTTASLPADDVEVPDYNQQNAAQYLTITTPANAAYLCVYFYHSSHSQLSPTAILENMMIKQEDTPSRFEPYKIINVYTNNLEDGAATPAKTSFSRNSQNLFDASNADLFSGYADATVHPGTNQRSIIFECSPNTTYTVSRGVMASRFRVCTLADYPESGDSTLQQITENDQSAITIKTAATANYMMVFFYHSSYDTTVTPEDIMKTIMIELGNKATPFAPYGKVLDIKSYDLEDGSVTLDKLAPEVTNTSSLTTRSKVYGVEFEIDVQNPKCTRVGDAVGLHNDYIVGDTFQLNDGVNDFDHIFPWSDIRRCNLSFDANGKKVITYDSESAFKLDGSNGNVMVQIPKFYSMRSRIGNKETWAITGEPKSGFAVDPAFVVNGKEIDFIYVSCYQSAPVYNSTVFSRTGVFPEVQKTLASFISDYSSAHLQSYDLTVFLMLQKLLTIEFGTRNVQSMLGGITKLPYTSAGSSYTVTSFGTNYITAASTPYLTSLWPGERIVIGAAENTFTNIRNVTEVTVEGSSVTIKYDGEDLSPSLSVGAVIGALPQKNGLADGLNYHTGRTTLSSGHANENYVNPMRYRFIENLYGNVWEKIAGLKIKNLAYYASNVPNYMDAVDAQDSSWSKLGYAAPLQTGLGNTNQAWIVKQGYDLDNVLINLPILCGSSNGGGDNKFFSDCFFSANSNASTEYTAAVGGGWDHSVWAGPFTLRANLAANDTFWLYGNRPICRG